MIMGRIYKDEEGLSRMGRIHISLEKLASLLNLRGDMNLVGLNVDVGYSELVVCISGPGLPVHVETTLVDFVQLSEVQ